MFSSRAEKTVKLNSLQKIIFLNLFVLITPIRVELQYQQELKVPLSHAASLLSFRRDTV